MNTEDKKYFFVQADGDSLFKVDFSTKEVCNLCKKECYLRKNSIQLHLRFKSILFLLVYYVTLLDFYLK